MRFTSRLIAIGAATLLTVSALTACSVAGSGEQSTQDACGVLAEGLGNVQEQVTAADTALTNGDMSVAQANLKSASAGLNSVSPQITNAEIAPILRDLTAGLDNINAVITDGAAAGTDAADQALQASTVELRAVVQRFNDACGG